VGPTSASNHNAKTFEPLLLVPKDKKKIVKEPQGRSQGAERVLLANRRRPGRGKSHKAGTCFQSPLAERFPSKRMVLPRDHQGSDWPGLGPDPRTRHGLGPCPGRPGGSWIGWWANNPLATALEEGGPGGSPPAGCNRGGAAAGASVSGPGGPFRSGSLLGLRHSSPKDRHSAALKAKADPRQGGTDRRRSDFR